MKEKQNTFPMKNASRGYERKTVTEKQKTVNRKQNWRLHQLISDLSMVLSENYIDWRYREGARPARTPMSPRVESEIPTPTIVW